MNNVLKHNHILKKTEALIYEWYDSDNIENIMKMVDDDTVAYRENANRFFVGKVNVGDFLRQEIRKQAPCTVYKTRCNEQITDDGITVTVHVILKMAKYASLRWYNIKFMYRGNEDHHKLAGINVSRDLHHEGTYHNIRAKIIHKKLQHNIANNRTPGIVGEFVSVCSVVYSMADDEHTLRLYDYHFWRMLGYSSEDEFREQTQCLFLSLLHDDDKEYVRHDYMRQVLELDDMYQLEYRLRCKDGSYIWILECGQRVLNRDGKPQNKSIITDISTFKNTHDDLVYRVSYDEMTGVFNKQAFYQHARRMMIDNPDKQFRLLRANVARFKVINELLGEEEGDKLLKEIGSFLSNMNLPLCVSGRLYSDHFVICFSADDEVLNRIMYSLRYVASSFNLRHRTVLNFGLYDIDDINIPIGVMCDRANIALIRAKEDFNNPYRKYDDEMRRQMVVEQEILNVLDKAFDEREFLVYLQPKYETNGETLIGAEALVRWNHAEKNEEGEKVNRFISPADFVPVFERNGLIYDLDKYIWEETCRLIWRWLKDGYDVKPISVNVSRVDLYDPGLVDFLVDLRERYEIPHDLLELELTESAYTNDPIQIIQVTDRLKEAGFTILMDDFGSGYSSLNMLKDVHVDVLKLDMGFLRSQDQSGRGGNILSAVVGMAKSLKLYVIAEGVEFLEQVEFLRSIGCYRVQGYYYSKPLPTEEYVKRMSRIDKKLIDKVDM